jgi:hypothetical protein
VLETVQDLFEGGQQAEQQIGEDGVAERLGGRFWSRVNPALCARRV